MQETKPSLKKIAFNNGLLLALASILIMVIMYVSGIQKSLLINLISFGINIAILVYAIKTYKRENFNFLSFSEGLKVGMATVAVASVITGVYMFIHFSYISPETIEVAREEAHRQIAENAGITQEQKEQSVKISDMFTSPFMFTTIGVIMSLFFGFIISLVATAILRKENTAR